VITGDIGSALGLDASGTWRPPPGPDAAPGTYATSLPFSVARSTGEEPRPVAAALAAKLRAAGWVADASVTGGGYLTVTVTPEALATLAVRVVAAGAGCATSNALSGHSFPLPPVADLAAAADWDQAWDLVAAQVTARLAAVAGAQIVKAKKVTERRADVRAGPADAVAVAGAEAVRYALTRTPFHRVRLISPMTYVRNTLENPFFAVRYAHARAASVRRWAGDLGIDGGEPGEFRPELLAQPAERELLDAISWLPERAASAARRRRPDAFARYLEWLASSWLSCAGNCPALPFGGRSAPRDQAGIAARLWLAAAAATATETCLQLVGVTPPDRL
jgi:arginyl-tRNA synthetase